MSTNFLENLDAVLNENAELISSMKQALSEQLAEQPEIDDLFLYRFLKGYGFDLEKSTQACQQMLQWRKQNNLGSIRPEAKNMNQRDMPFAKVLEKCFPHNIYHKTDRNGQPLSIDRMGHCDPGMITKLISQEDLVRYQLYHAEMKSAAFAELSRATGRVIRGTKIVDLDGMGRHQFDRKGINFVKTIIGLMQSNYPEHAATIWFVNVPFVFKALFAMIKPLLRPITLEKMVFLGDDYRTELHKYVDPANLPKYLGGTCECEGGCVRESDPNAGYSRVDVAARGTYKQELKLAAGAVVDWQFRTEYHDLGFSATFSPDNGAPIVVVPAARIDCSSFVANGEYGPVATAGTMTFLWDNSHSWIRGKVMWMRLDQRDAQSDTLVDSPLSIESAASAAAASSPLGSPSASVVSGSSEEESSSLSSSEPSASSASRPASP